MNSFSQQADIFSAKAFNASLTVDHAQASAASANRECNPNDDVQAQDKQLDR